MIPHITHLQFAVLAALAQGEEKPGKYIRHILAAKGQVFSGPGFYQMMARLEKAGYLMGRYDQQMVDKQIIRERKYALLTAGYQALNETREFYRAEITE